MLTGHRLRAWCALIAILFACQSGLAAGAPGTAYLGPDVLWRTREGLVFHMQDDVGTGFQVTFTVRDMNVYMQGHGNSPTKFLRAVSRCRNRFKP